MPGKSLILDHHINECTKKIKQGQHVLLTTQDDEALRVISSKAIDEAKVLHCKINFALAGSPESVIKIVFNRIENFILNGLSITKKSTEKLLKSFALFTPEIILSASGTRIKLHEPTGYSIEKTIECALLALDDLSKQLNKKVCVTLEEFQILFGLKELDGLADNLKKILKKSTRIQFILFGSEKDKVLEAYGLIKNDQLHKLTFNRPKSADLARLIDNQPKESKFKNIKKSQLQSVMNLTQGHLLYTDILINHITKQNKFTDADLTVYWHELALSKQHEINKQLLSLSNNQKIAINHLAQNPTNQPFNVRNMPIHMNAASYMQAVKKLIKLDLLHVDYLDIYRLKDPTFEYYLKHIL
jgi:hypothetical protein